MSENEALLLTTKEAAAQVRLEPGTLENWRTQGKGPPYVKLGRTVRYPADKLRAWWEERQAG